MEKKDTSLIDEHLESLQGMKEAGTDEFFFTRLKARMSSLDTTGGLRVKPQTRFILKPVWVISVLVVLLGINGYMLSQQSKSGQADQSNSYSVQGFAQSYDQTISSY